MKGWLITIFALLNALLYLIVIGMWISIPEELALNLFTTLAALLITTGLIINNRSTFATYYKSLYFRNLISAFISALLIFVILGFINFLAYKNPVVWDVTKNKRNSLTDQTYQVLEQAKGEINFTIFSLKKDYELIRTLVELYRLKKSDIKISFVDAEISPQKVQNAGITKVPAIQVEKGDKSQVVTELNELSLTNALVKITRATDPMAYFSTGHGEMDFSSQKNEGGVHLARLLKNNTYQLRALNLRESGKIPDDAGVLIIWGPKEGFFPNEIKVIRNYIEKGGKLMLALDPDVNSKGQVELMGIMKDYGLLLTNDLVIDRIKHANGSQGTVPVAHKFDPRHPITKELKGSIFFPLVSSVRPIETGNKAPWKVLAESNRFPAAWGETNPMELVSMKMVFNEGEDHKGPLGYLAAYEKENRKMVVFGNSTFVQNSYQKFPKNFMLFLNAINWVSGEERLIAFNNPVIEDRPIFMSKNQIGVIFYFTVIFCPLMLAIAAFILYKRRQKL